MSGAGERPGRLAAVVEDVCAGRLGLTQAADEIAASCGIGDAASVLEFEARVADLEFRHPVLAVRVWEEVVGRAASAPAAAREACLAAAAFHLLFPPLAEAWKRELLCLVADTPEERRPEVTLRALAALVGRDSTPEGRAEDAARFERASALAAHLADTRAEGVASLRRATRLRADGRMPDAERLLRLTRKRAAAWGHRDIAACALDELGVCLHLRGKTARALLFAAAAMDLAREGEYVFVEAKALINRGNFLYSESRYDEALALEEAARSLCRRLDFPQGERIAMAKISDVHLALGRWDEAEELLLESIAMARSLGERLGEATQAGNLANLYRLRGRYAQAEEWTERGVRLAREVGDRRICAANLCHLGRLHLELGNLSLARTALEEADRLYNKEERGYQAALGCLDYGRALFLLDRAQEAQVVLSRAVELAAEAKSMFTVAEAKGYLGLVLAAGGDPLSAAGLLAEAALRARDLRNHPSEALFKVELARVRETLNPDDGEIDGLLREALEAVERLLTFAPDEPHRLLYEKRFEGAYAAAVRRALRRRDADDAFDVAERSRARAFLDLLAAGRHPACAPEDGQLLRLWERFQEARSAHSAFLDCPSRVPRPDIEARLRGELDDAEAAYASCVRGRAGAEAGPAPLPHHHSFRYRPEVAGCLEPGMALLAYYTTPAEVHVFAASGSDRRLRHRTLALPERELQRLVERATLPRAIGREWRVPPEDLARAYRKLVEPVRDAIAPGAELVVVPHGALHALSFDTLLETEGRHLRDSFPGGTTIAPSGSVFVQTRSRPTPERLLHLAALVNPATGAPGLVPAEIEVEEVACHFEKARIVRREEATREALFEAAAEADAVHVAAHGEAVGPGRKRVRLRLAASGADPRGGEVDVHDLYRLRTRARLFVLNACVSAQGRLLPGDEIVGLVRGCFSAGVSTVLAALWELDSVATSFLVPEFYRQVLVEGRPQSLALRLAQDHVMRLDRSRVRDRVVAARSRTDPADSSCETLARILALLDAPGAPELPYRDPYYWGGMVLFGDGR